MDLQGTAILEEVVAFWVTVAILVGEVGGVGLTMEPSPIPFGEEATSSFFHHTFAPTSLLPQSDAFSAQDPTPIGNTKEVQSDWSSVNMENGSTKL